MKEIFKNRLRQLRKENLKTQADLAKELGVARSTIAEYERGNIIPPTKIIEGLAKYFDVSTDYLLGNTNFHNHEEKQEAPKDIYDISKQIKLLLDHLNDSSFALSIEGEELDEDSRELIAASLENSLKVALMLNKKG